jgi:4-hydroxy-4-methyl-2-oxoglutarate aldolase
VPIVSQQSGGIPRTRGHRSIVPPRIVRNVPRPDPDVLERFGRVYLPDVSDRVGQLYTMASSIQPLYRPMRRLLGPALTVKAPPGDNSTVHLALAMCQPGDVLVVDSRGYTESCGTGASAMTVPISRGLAGVVVDGAWRDIEQLQALDFPIYGKGISPFSPPKHRLGEINVPVSCGGVIVHPGDVVMCDPEGGVVIPLEHAELVLSTLDDYHLPTSLQEWGVEERAAQPSAGAAYYRALFESQGGIYVD